MRGEIKPPKADGIYRATLRGDATHYREGAESVAPWNPPAQVKTEAGKNRSVQATLGSATPGTQARFIDLGIPGAALYRTLALRANLQNAQSSCV